MDSSKYGIMPTWHRLTMIVKCFVEYVRMFWSEHAFVFSCRVILYLVDACLF